MRNASSPQKAQKSQNEFSHLQGSLSLDSQADFSQTVGHPVFVYLLEMPVAKISIQVEGRLTDLITQSPHALVVSHRSALFVFLCLLWPFPAKIPLPHFANASLINHFIGVHSCPFVVRRSSSWISLFLSCLSSWPFTDPFRVFSNPSVPLADSSFPPYQPMVDTSRAFSNSLVALRSPSWPFADFFL